MNIIPFPGDSSSLAPMMPHPKSKPDEEWLAGFVEEMQERNKSKETIREYSRELKKFMQWVQTMPGGERGFYPALFTKTAAKEYFSELKKNGFSIQSQNKVKSALSMAIKYFAVQGDPLEVNPLDYIKIPAQAILQQKRLTKRQRFILKNLNDQFSGPREQAMFSVGMYAAFRVSEVADFRISKIQMSRTRMQVTIGVKNEQERTITLPPEARRAVEFYLYSDHPQARRQSKYAGESDYVFLSQRGSKMTNNAVNRWFTSLLKKAPVDQYEEIKEISWHDLRHDTAHRLLDDGWSESEISIFMGHIRRDGSPSLQTTARYTMPSAEDISARLLEFE